MLGIVFGRYGLSVLLNTYASHKFHCNDLSKNDIKDEIFYWKLDEMSIQSILFSRFFILISSLYTSIVNYALLICYFLIIYKIYKKNYTKKYDFYKEKIHSNSISYHIFTVSMYFFYGIILFSDYQTNMKKIFSWCIYLIALICYYSKFFIETNNIYYKQHDIAHALININYYIDFISDIV